MSDAPPELGRVALYLDQGSTERCLLFALRQRLLEQAAEPVLCALDLEEILDLLTCPRTRDVCAQKHATQHLTSSEPGGLHKGVQTRHVFIADARTNEVSKRGTTTY